MSDQLNGHEGIKKKESKGRDREFISRKILK
jgi:hypothetical protein